MNNACSSFLVRCLLVVCGASLAGWSLNHALGRSHPLAWSAERFLESGVLFFGLALVWTAALRPSGLDKTTPLWKRATVEGIPVVLALLVFAGFLVPLLG